MDSKKKVALIAVMAQRIARLLVKLENERAHGKVIIHVQDGKIQRFEVNRSYMPSNLPEV